MRPVHWLGGLWLLCAAPALGQELYRWVDAHGEEHFTDDAATVPRGARLKPLGEPQAVVHASPGQAATPASDDATQVPQFETPAPARPGVPTVAPAPKPEAGPVVVRLARVSTPLTPVDREFIAQAIDAAAASAQLQAWGGLLRSVDAEVADAATLDAGGEAAFGRAVSPTRVLLRDPSDVVHDGRPLDYEKTVLHELAHTLEMQRAGRIEQRWFSEGFANVVADFDGYASVDDVAFWVISRGGPTPLSAVFRHPQNLHVAYAVATHAVRLLVTEHGRDAVLDFFARRRRGEGFEEAFHQSFGERVPDFEARWVELLRPKWRQRAQ
jgi:hypothetical protein